MSRSGLWFPVALLSASGLAEGVASSHVGWPRRHDWQCLPHPLEARGDEDLLEEPFYLLESDLLESTALLCCSGRLSPALRATKEGAQGTADFSGRLDQPPLRNACISCLVAFACLSPAAIKQTSVEWSHGSVIMHGQRNHARLIPMCQ